MVFVYNNSRNTKIKRGKKTMRSPLLKKFLIALSLVMIFVLSLTSCFPTPPVTDGETSEGGNENENGNENGNEDNNDDEDDNNEDDNKVEIETITIAEALELCGEEGNITTDRYYIRAIIKTVTNAAYGAMVIEDETGSIAVYGTYSEDGSRTFTELEYQPVKGDEVLLHCILQNYNGTKEVKNARLISYVNNQGKQDISAYTPATIAEARAAEKGDKLLVEGVVARITYATGMKPSGYILVDGTSSIYVYDGDSAARVAIGNKVKIAGAKDYWILDKEIAGANKFGYGGCNQLTEVTLVSNDKGNNEFDTTWITESTVKDMMDTPVTEDVTTLVYKVNALVKKVPGSGFVNYYFFDLDGETGTYTYTQANGEDFAWLDEFDGKICTVYLTALNAKSSSTDCFFRFLPVKVDDNNFTFDAKNAPAYALKYHAMEQFFATYLANPDLEVITSVSSALLDINGITVSYTSDNETVAKFTEKEGKLYFECLASGTANITVTATYGDYTKSEVVAVKMINISDFNYVNVQTAIHAEKGETVTVRGIVGPSLVNRNGFYLMDDTGMISIIVNDMSVFAGLEIGHEVILTGKRDLFHNGTGTHAGQIALTGAVIEANLYGNHEYNTTNFVTDKTLADFHDLDVEVQYSTTVFVLRATIVFVDGGRYTKYELTDGNVTVALYCSSGAQYGFLEQFAGQEVTIELAACNWNNKDFWAGCILSVITEDGKVYNTLHFDNN